MFDATAFATATADVPDDAVYVRYNEFGGITRSHTMAAIRELFGRNGWMVEYDREADEMFCFRLGDRGTGHTLKRRK